MFQSEDYDSGSSITLEINTDTQKTINNWSIDHNNKWVCDTKPAYYKGVYEGSLFYGSRFEDSRIVDKLIRDKQIRDDDIIDAFDYVKEKLSFILHGDNEHYQTMKK
ncbi:hypothetical protein [Aeromonas jandaei]